MPFLYVGFDPAVVFALAFLVVSVLWLVFKGAPDDPRH